MTDLLVVTGAVAAALSLAWFARVRSTAGGPQLDVTGLAEGPAVVIFTQDECSTCEAAMERVQALGLPVRQVRAEDEPQQLTGRGVEGVPTTVLIDHAGRVCGQFGGLPSRWMLRRAAARAMEIPGGAPRDL